MSPRKGRCFPTSRSPRTSFSDFRGLNAATASKPKRSWRASACPHPTQAVGRTSFRAASSSAWLSPARSRRSRSLCCSTSPFPLSTLPCVSKRGKRSRRSCRPLERRRCLVTHDQSEALSMGRQVAVLRDGALAQVAAPEKLYRQPADAALAQFVGEAVLLPGVVAGRFATCALGQLELARSAPDGPVEVMVRPEQIRFVSRATPGAVRGAGSRRNLLRP